MKSNKELALEYLKLGWSVFPIQRTKIPYSGFKWSKYQEKLPTVDEIEAWWNKWPKANIAVVTGRLSNLAVLDFDDPGAIERFEACVDDLPATILSKTGKGFHYFFKCPENGLQCCNGLYEKVDLKADGGYVVIPPSLHQSGKQYSWNGIDPIEDGIDDLLDMPKAIFESCCKISKNKKEKDPNWIVDALHGVSKGKRNATASRVAGYYFRQHPGNKEIVRSLMDIWNSRNTPPLTPDELSKVINSIAEREGVNAFGKLVGIDVSDFQILRYPDHTVKYNLYLSDFDYPVELTPQSILNQAAFRSAFVTITDRIVRPQKTDDFYDSLQRLMNDGTTVEMDEEGTLLAFLRGEIKSTCNKVDLTDDPFSLIENTPIEYQGSIILKLTQLMHHLGFKNEGKKLTRTEIVRYLKLMGFDNNDGVGMRFGNERKKVRIWKIKKEDFREL